jgi:hypothetical protein
VANEIPPETLEEFWDDLIGGGTVKARAYDNTHGYVSGTDTFIGDLTGGALGTALTLTTTTTTSGELTATSGSLGTIAGGTFVDAVAIYIDTGSPATSRILAWIDTNSDGTDMNKEGDGGAMTIVFPSDLIARI